MCESAAFVEGDGEPELILKDVATIKPQGDGWLLVSLFGEKRQVNRKLKLIDLMGHRILFDQKERTLDDGEGEKESASE